METVARKPPNAGKGRVKGTPNKVTGELKEMILGALGQAGGIDYLKAKAETHPQAFMSLLGRVLPMQVSGDPNNPVRASVTLEIIGIPAPKG